MAAGKRYKRFAGPSVNNAGYHNENWDKFHDGNELRDVSYDSLAEALTYIGTATKTLYITTRHRVTSSRTIPSNISVVVLKGGSFDRPAGVTLTIAGPFKAGIYQVFSGAGSVVFTGAMDCVYSEWWGATSTAYDVTPTADCAAAIRSAIASIQTNGGTVQFLDRQYAFASQIAVDTNGIGSLVRLKGKNDWRSVLYYTGSQSPALKFGLQLNPDSNPTAANSGLVDLVDIHISGAGASGEVNGVQISNAQRYTHWENVRIRGFSKGLGLEMYWIFTTGWGNVTIDQCYQALSGTVVNSFNMGLHVEICGPYEGLPTGHARYYNHSTIAPAAPSVYMNGEGMQFDTLEIEGNFAINSCEIEEQVTILNYYSEGNYPHDTGHELTFSGGKPALISGKINPGVYATPPNPRYLIGMNDSEDAYIENLAIIKNITDPTNTVYGVDFETSNRARVNVWMEQFSDISQEVAQNQLYKANNKTFTLNGMKYVCGMPIKALGKLLFDGYNKVPLEHWTMEKPGSALQALGFTADNLSADSILKKFPSPLGNGRVQKIERNAVSPAGIYYRFAPGDLSATDKYFFSSFIHRAVANGTAALRVLNNAVDQNWYPQDTGWLGWQRVSNIRAVESAATNNVDVWPCYISSSSVHYTAGLMVINLSEFDAVYGTALADMSTAEVEEVMDAALMAPIYREYSREAAPVDGTYVTGNVVWSFPSSSSKRMGYRCVADGTPGTWVQFGEIFQGTTLAAANNFTPGDGNSFIVSGATQINLIASTGAPAYATAGTRIVLEFTGAPLVKNNQSTSAGFAAILLKNRRDFQAAAGDVLGLIYNGTTWNEEFRTLATTDANLEATSGDAGITSGEVIGKVSFVSVDSSSGASGSRGRIEAVNDSGASWDGTAANEDTRIDTYVSVDRTETLAKRIGSDLSDSTYGDLKIVTAGKGIKIAEGSNAKMGVSTLVNGTVTVSTTAVLSTSRVKLTNQGIGASTAIGVLTLGTVTNATSFVINARKADATLETGDQSVVHWEIVDPA